MIRSSYLVFLATVLATSSPAPTANVEGPLPIQSKQKGSPNMSQVSAMIDLFNRWEQVWNEGKLDMVASCVADSYIRHDPKGDRTVTRNAYTEEVAKIHKERPDIRVVVYDHSFSGDRAWFRFAFQWTDTKTGEVQTQAGMQAYRIVDNKLAETWISFLPAGTIWPDAPQPHWTSAPAVE